MLADDSEILAELSSLNKKVVTLAYKILEAAITDEEWRAFAQHLARVAETIRDRIDRHAGTEDSGRCIERVNRYVDP